MRACLAVDYVLWSVTWYAMYMKLAFTVHIFVCLLLVFNHNYIQFFREIQRVAWVTCICISCSPPNRERNNKTLIAFLLCLYLINVHVQHLLAIWGTDRSLLTGQNALLLRKIARDLLHALSHGLCWTIEQHWLEQVSDMQITRKLSTWSKRI